MDVAGFVGFAERGPLDTPTALEDFGQYRAVFGGDLMVAREGGRPLYAHLPRTVQAFFDNGGRRCYVVRVAGEGARVNWFRLPGLLVWSSVEGIDGLSWAVAPAASRGAWSDTMRLSTQLRVERFQVRAFRPGAVSPPQGTEIEIEASNGDAVRPGDLLRLTGADSTLLVFRVANVTVDSSGGRVGTTRLIIAAHPLQELGFATSLGEPIPMPSTVHRLVERLDAFGDPDRAEPPPSVWQLVGMADRPFEPVPSRPGVYGLFVPTDAGVATGDLLRVACSDGREALMTVGEVGWSQDDASPPQPSSLRLLIRSTLVPQPFPATLADPAVTDRMAFDLTIREGEEVEGWRELRLGAGPGFWLDHLSSVTDAGAAGPPDLSPHRSRRLGAPRALPDESRDAEAIASASFYVPLAMAELPETFVGPIPEAMSMGSPPAVTPGKDGLDRFDPALLFLDRALRGVGTRALADEAERLMFLSAAPRRLTGLHSFFPIEELGLVSVPDATHRGWGEPEPLPPGEEPPVPPPTTRDWSSFEQCMASAPPDVEAPGLPAYAPCEPPLGVGLPEAEFEPLALRQRIEALPVAIEPAAYGPDELSALLELHRALVRFAAARADLVTVLSLPGHAGTAEALDWQRQLVDTPEFRDGSPLSYAAFYHPWVLVREETTPDLAPLRATPPDGAVCGSIAARDRARGPWIAPAGLSLREVLGLTPELKAADWPRLFDVRANLLRHPPGQFSTLSAHTLSDDPQLMQVSVRRLLIFLRKLALRRGMRYVFEVSNDRFRQRVQLSFERTLTELAARGALVAFQVVTGPEITTPADYDAGRFLIALKVAPTLPIEFITVVLLRSGEGLLEVIER